MTLLVAKQVICRTGGPGFIWMSPGSSIQRVWTIFRDLVIRIGLWGDGKVITLRDLLDFNLETVSQMGSDI